MSVSLVPELDVTDLDASLAFYVGLIGFAVVLGRRHERFASLALDRAELMLQDADGPGDDSAPLLWLTRSAGASISRSQSLMSTTSIRPSLMRD